MTPQVMIQPSSLMYEGIQSVQTGSFYLFRFTDGLQTRFEELLERNKTEQLTADEQAELAGISDLSRIFTFINAQLAAQAKWCPTPLETWYANVPATSANTVIHPNT
jgi:hypothetical protein